MPRDGAPRGETVHATAVAIDGRAILICGASNTGKSRLAAALVAASTPSRRIELIGDDRIVVIRDRGGRTQVRPHPRIAGFLERRGLGLVAMPFREEAPLAALVDLDGATRRNSGAANFPVLSLVHVCGEALRRDRLLAWWSSRLERQTDHTMSEK